jgi:hypothetical protein
MSATTPRIQISWGELFDRITILEIKAQRLSSKTAIENVSRELEALNTIANDGLPRRPDVEALKQELKSLNETLWDVEDKIRAKEAEKSFDQAFIALARSVYLHNDKRGELKRRINELLNSDIVEEKEYTRYST